MGTATFPTGTKTIFNSSTAPTGWTIDTTAAFNNATIRVVGSGGTWNGTGGSQNFSTTMVSTPVATYGPVTVTNPGVGTGANVGPVQSAHSHNINNTGNVGTYDPHTARTLTNLPLSQPTPIPMARMVAPGPGSPTNPWAPLAAINSSATGGTTTHQHPLSFNPTTTIASGTVSFAVNYVDFIVASIN